MVTTSVQLEADERRVRVAEYLKKGFSRREIAGLLDVSYETISRDADALEKDRQKRKARDYEEHKADLGEELALVRKELWMAWERSKNPTKSVTKTTRKIRPGKNILKGRKGEEDSEGGGEGKAENLVVDGEVVSESGATSVGNPIFTNQLMQCIAQEAQLFGLVNKDGNQESAPPVLRMYINPPPDSDPDPENPDPTPPDGEQREAS